MARVSQEAVQTALQRIWNLELSTRIASFLESFLCAKWMKKQEGDAVAAGEEERGMSIAATDEAVRHLFTVFPDHAKGRLYPFRPESYPDKDEERHPRWQDTEASGRKTIWNASTRQRQKILYVDEHMRNGLRDDAVDILKQEIPAEKRPDLVDLAAVMLRDDDLESLDSEALVSAFASKFGLSDAELDAISNHDSGGWKTTQLPEGEPWTPNALPEHWKPPSDTAGMRAGGGEGALPQVHSLEDEFEIALDDRVFRMIRTSLMAYSGIIAVGPPGTGKTTLVEQVVAEVLSTPDSYGFQTAPGEPVVATPDEGWSTKELVGGESVVDGKLQFVNGFVLNAIAENRWLILDEINRADMDRIFGALFTWLSGKSVEVGRTGPKEGSKRIVLGWSGQPECVVAEEGNQIRFLAGDEWRLLGTYNAVDASKVFRFGQALGRRFVRVPIPAATPAEIHGVFRKACEGLPERTLNDLLRLYAAHYDVESLGPALFIRIPAYLKSAGLEKTTEDPELLQHLAESYVVNVGGWLGKLEETQLQELKGKLVGAGNPFTESDWDWILNMAGNMG